MSDTKWELIAAHIKEVETQESETYVNTVKAWLKEHQDGDTILAKARRQWKETQPAWYQTLLAVGMGNNNQKFPKPPPDTTEGSGGTGDNQPVEKNPSSHDSLPDTDYQ